MALLRMPVMERERAYLEELVARLRALLGQALLGVYAGGSFALGGYEPGRSDLDVAAVVRERLDEGVADRIVDALRHESLPSPARKLELVVYTEAAARKTSTEPDFELNLNTGPDEQFRADLAPQPGEGHWFAIDRSVLARNGVSLYGPPASEVFAEPSQAELLPILAQVLRWYLREEPESEDALLNAGRSLRFAREGIWSQKPDLRSWAANAVAEAGSKEAVLRQAIGELEG
jgi:nucleotidyltransferase-like protein